jgi:hypothetical protein
MNREDRSSQEPGSRFGIFTIPICPSRVPSPPLDFQPRPRPPISQRSLNGSARGLTFACSERGPATASPWGSQAPIAPPCPVWLPPEPGRAWMVGWRGPHEAQGGLSRLLCHHSVRSANRLGSARNRSPVLLLFGRAVSPGAGWVRRGRLARSIRRLRDVSNEPNEPCPAARRWRVLWEAVVHNTPRLPDGPRRAWFQPQH